MTIYDLPTPVLLIDWPVAQRNIQTAAKLVAGTGAAAGADGLRSGAGFSEEHTLVRRPGHNMRVGDRLQLQPGHANGTINLYRQVVVHDGGTVRHIWPIAATGYALPA